MMCKISLLVKPLNGPWTGSRWVWWSTNCLLSSFSLVLDVKVKLVSSTCGKSISSHASYSAVYFFFNTMDHLDHTTVSTLTSFYFNYQNPSVSCFLVQIWAIVISTSTGLTNLKIARKGKGKGGGEGFSLSPPKACSQANTLGQARSYQYSSCTSFISRHSP